MERSLGVKQEVTKDILDLFKPQEGDVCFYYGRIRNGKTYAATADILELLERGEIVYANWPIKWEGLDERKSFRHILLKFLFGKKDFFVYKKDNFHYFHPDEIDIDFLGSLVGVHIFIDEGQWIFNSHVRNPDPKKQRLILHNGHYCRSLNIISQRPSNVFKDMRSQVNIWFKCEKFSFMGITLFHRTMIQDMKDDMPDEEAEMGRKIYFQSDRVRSAYNTHAMRGPDAKEPVVDMEVYSLDGWDKIVAMFRLAPKPKIRLKTKRATTERVAPVVAPVKPYKSFREAMEESRAKRLVDSVGEATDLITPT